MCGVRCVVCGVMRAVCGVMCAVCCVRNVVRGMWCVVYCVMCVCYAVCGVWYIVCSVRCAVCGVRCAEYNKQCKFFCISKSKHTYTKTRFTVVHGVHRTHYIVVGTWYSIPYGEYTVSSTMYSVWFHYIEYNQLDPQCRLYRRLKQNA